MSRSQGLSTDGPVPFPSCCIRNASIHGVGSRPSVKPLKTPSVRRDGVPWRCRAWQMSRPNCVGTHLRPATESRAFRDLLRLIISSKRTRKIVISDSKDGVCSYFGQPDVDVAEVTAVCVGEGRVKLPLCRLMTYRGEPAIPYLIRSADRFARAFSQSSRQVAQHCAHTYACIDSHFHCYKKQLDAHWYAQILAACIVLMLT